jgi:two-component system chemotaxis response regulator CheY
MSLKDSLRVMVVDDMSVSRGLIVQSLEEIGIWNTTTENNGHAALAKLVANPVHLVLSDMNMPMMDGLGLLKGLRENRTTQKIGFILITGTPTPQLVQRGQALGMNNMVKKPFTSAILKQAIERVVGRL